MAYQRDDILEYAKPLDDDTLPKYFWAQYKRSEEHFEPIWKEAANLFRMYAAESLSDTDKRYLDQTKRVIVDVPFAKGVIDTVIGAEMAQRTEPVFHGSDEGPNDNVKADKLTQAVRHVRGRCDAHRHETGAYFDMLIGGYGFAEAYLDLTKVPIRPIEKHIEVWEMLPDPDAVEDNLTDSRFFIRKVDWEIEQVQARWPDKTKDIELAISDKKVTSPYPKTQVSGRWTRGSVTGRSLVTVFEFQYRRYEPRVVYYDPETGERVDTSKSAADARRKELEKQAQAIMAEHAQAVMDHEQAVSEYESRASDPLLGMDPGPPPVPPEAPPTPPQLSEEHNYAGEVWYRAYLLGNARKSEGVVLENRAISINQPTIKVVTGYKWKDHEEGRVRFFGLMRVIYDAAVWLNRALSTYLEIMGRGAKGGGFIGKSALGNMMTVDQFQKQRSTPGVWTMLEDVAFGGSGPPLIEHLPVQATPSGFEEIYRMMIELIGLLTGVTQALQGTLQSERSSNVLVSNLQEQGLQMLLPIREPRTAFTIALGRLVAALVVKHIPAGDLDKILGYEMVEGLTAERDPMGELVPIPTGEIDQETGQPKPLTFGMILKEIDLLEYDTVVDVGVATPTQRQSTWQWFSQHGLGQLLKDWGVPPDIILPEILRNSPLPGTISKKMGDDLEAFYEQQQKTQTSEGILETFAQMFQQDPNGAGELLAQIEQMTTQPQAPPS